MARRTLERVREEIAQLAEVPVTDVTEDVNLMDLGLDSLRAISLAQRWMNDGIPVEFSELAEEPTLRHWWSVLSRVQGDA